MNNIFLDPVTQRPALITRRLAADTGYRFFYTGKPCAHGHDSVRYVTNGGCKTCMRGNFKPKLNAYSQLLIPYNNPNLWFPACLTKAGRVTVRVEIQKFIFKLTRESVLPQLPQAQRDELSMAMREVEALLPRVSADDPTNTD